MPGSQPPAPARRSFGPELPFPLGRYTLCRELGAGGMATVYLGKVMLAAEIERLVAVKTIHPHLARDPVFVDMFLDEARIASHINHPNVCAVFDFGDVDGIYYLAMEYLVGEPVSDIIPAIGAATSLRDRSALLAARVIADAAEGLHAAHTLVGSDGQLLKVVHRDVSPQNLFVTYEGSVKVVDFGCAKALERVTETNTGIMKGKVAYAAPEQLRAEALDARVDVFALGICLWELLAFKHLFRRENAILTAQAVLQEPIPRADDDRPWVPKALADIVEIALSRDRERRYGSARELGRALRAYIAGAGRTFESAEVADCLATLFADRHSTTLRTIDAVQKIQVSTVAPSPVSAVAETEAAPTPRPQNVWKFDEDEDDEPVRLPTRTGGRMVALLLVLSVLGAGGYAAYRYRNDIETWMGGGASSESSPLSDSGEHSGGEHSGVEHSGVESMAPEADPPGPSESPSESESPPVEDEVPRRTERRHSRDESAPREPAPPSAPAPRAAANTAEHDVVRPSRTLDFSRGSVAIRTERGWAIVEHNGTRLGRTPLRIQLPVGRQRLRILPYGRGPAREVAVDVTWGELRTITAPMSPY